MSPAQVSPKTSVAQAILGTPGTGRGAGKMTGMSESFPRLHARTRRFTLGVPRGFTIAPGGDRVVFLRTKGGSDPVTCLWEFDVASGKERLIADPRALAVDEDDLPAEERARRERSREQA